MDNDFKTESNHLTCLNRTDSFLLGSHEEVQCKLLNKTAHLNLNQQKGVALDDTHNCAEGSANKDLDEEEAWSCLQDKILRVLNYKCNEYVDKYQPRIENIRAVCNPQEEEEEIETFYLQNFSENDLVPVKIEIVPSVLPIAEHAQFVNIQQDNIFIRACRFLRNVVTLKHCRRK